MLERFRNEVRLARQVSHPNVCRMYDLGETDGLVFLSMEYIDGEDLASLLRRIGHLPPAKARETAHKLCAGLAAAHEKGVIHRDFKPANIMIDGRGQVLITDFGLAATGTVEAGDIRSGTPAYMAPEQLRGAEVTVRSDIYALGLVLYEIFTGHAPFEASGREELIRKQSEGPPPMTDVDGVVERTIARALDPDPRRRYATVQAVANALAGGDPLQAALAAGQTPSPEMVAAAGETEGMNPRAALACVAVIVVGILAASTIAGKGWAFSRAGAETPPEAMTQKARDLLAGLGYTGKPGSSAGGYATDASALEHLAGTPIDEAWRRIATARPPIIMFWYRQSPDRLIAGSYGSTHVTGSDPALDIYGMVNLRLDAQGRLSRLTALPRSQRQPDEAAPPFEWRKLFDAAGFDMAHFEATAPRVVPPFAFDQRSAWVGTEDSGRLRVEAAAWHGLPVVFTMGADTPERASSAVQARFQRGDMARILFAVFLLLAEVVLAWRNVKLGRGDAAGALRVGGVVAMMDILYHLLSQSHGLDYGEYSMLMRAVGESLLEGGRMAAAYLAFEPFIRRRWPDVLISWTRVLSGAWRDPLAGRHVLMGVCGGALLSTVYKMYDLLLGPSSSGARSVDLYNVANTARTLAQLSAALGDAVGDACWAAFLVFLFALVFRKQWAAAAFGALLWGGVQASGSSIPLWTLALWLFVFGVLYFLLFRYGLLACVAYAYTGEVIMNLPMTLDSGTWYFGASALALVVLGVVTFAAYRAAVAGRAAWVAE
jgi:serine/threonine-protein kinase